MANAESQSVLGAFKVSEKALITIVETAAMEVAGVAGMANFSSSLDMRDFKNILNKGILPKTTRVRLSEEAVGIELCIKIFAGSSLKDTAREVQKNVKEAVQNMTGLIVSFVNVTISGICAQEKDDCGCGCEEGSDCSCEECPKDKQKTKKEAQE